MASMYQATLQKHKEFLAHRKQMQSIHVLLNDVSEVVDEQVWVDKCECHTSYR